MRWVPDLHGQHREESKGVTPQPAHERAERLMSSMDRASCWGGPRVKREALNWLRDCNSDGLIEANSAVPGVLLS